MFTQEVDSKMSLNTVNIFREIYSEDNFRKQYLLQKFTGFLRLILGCCAKRPGLQTGGPVYLIYFFGRSVDWNRLPYVYRFLCSNFHRAVVADLISHSVPSGVLFPLHFGERCVLCFE
jgi:hypothetical protein